VSLVGENKSITIIDGVASPDEYYVVGLDADEVTFTGFTVKNGNFAVHLNHRNCVVEECNIWNNTCGIVFEWGPLNKIRKNIIWNNTCGIAFTDSSHFNLIKQNTISNNDLGVYIEHSRNLSIYHNIFLSNTVQVEIGEGGNNSDWDDGYPSGGNYWSDYNGTDTNQDGIGDVSYTINENNVDNYPLMAPINIFDAGTWNGIAYNVDVIGNSSISDFYFNPDEGAFLRFNVTGPENTTGFCRVTIPKDLLWVQDGQWNVLVDGQPVNYTIIPASDENYTYLYFTYNHSTKAVVIQGTSVIPEFPSATILPLFMLTTLIATILLKKKRKAKSQLHTGRVHAHTCKIGIEVFSVNFK